MMNYEETINYIHSVSWLGSRPGLSRIDELCKRLGDPQKKLKFIHVAGTNGKGSFCSMMTSVLMCSGKHVGTFTSPYVYSFNERMCYNGKPITDSELCEVIEKVRPHAEAMEDHPTEFELITAAAFEFFLMKNVDVVILEAGLGGRLDSTNIIESSILSVITGIALDHTDILGDTLEKIAMEKAGIIKKSCPILCGSDVFSVQEVIKTKAREHNSDYSFTDYRRIQNEEYSVNGCRFEIEGYASPFEISLCGTYQPKNALLVITAAEILGIEEKHIRMGLKAAKWPARFEVLSHRPVIIFDGGHNPQGLAAAINSYKKIFSSKCVVLTGMMKDKDYDSAAKSLSEIADTVYCTMPDNPRALDSDKFKNVFEALGVRAHSIKDVTLCVKSAALTAEKKGLPMLCIGSLYMYRQVRDAVEN